MTNTYFVDSANGSDGNAGTSAGAAWATIQHAHDFYVDGGTGVTINILPGNGYGGGTSQVNVVNVTRSGSVGRGWGYYEPANPATAPSPTPTLTAPYPGPDPQTAVTYCRNPGSAMPVVNGSQSWQTFFIGDGSAHDIIVDGIEFVGWNSSLNSQTVWNTVSTGALITNPVHQGNGVIVGGHGDLNHHILVRNCHFHDFPGSGLASIDADYVSFCGNTIHDCGLYSTYATSGMSIYSGNSFDGVTTTKSIANGNILYHNRSLVPNWGNFPNGGYGTTTTTAARVTGDTIIPVASIALNGDAFGVPLSSWVQNRQILFISSSNPGALAFSTHVLSVSGLNITLDRPLIGNLPQNATIYWGVLSDGGGIIFDTMSGYNGRCLAMNNLCVNNGAYGILANAGQNTDLIFNTCYLNQTEFWSGEVVLVSQSVAGGSFCRNNICQALSGTAANPNIIGAWDAANSTYTNNLGFGGDGGNLQGTSNLNQTDPKFNAPTTSLTYPVSSNFFKLLASSPAIGAASGSATRVVDILGNSGNVGGASDLGAYEFFVASSIIHSYVRHHK